jgi:hypothetical protein
MSHPVGTEPPLPPLVHVPIRRVCICGQFFTRTEEARRGTCDVCDARAAIHNSLASFFPCASSILTPGGYRATR